ncbi:MAG: ChaN family lipoprotein [Magnetococcus sp. MYC-9]
MALRWCISLLAGAFFLAGCGTFPLPLQEELILETASGRILGQDILLERMLQVQVIHLGEQHDNPHHHRLQRVVLERLLARGKRPALGFEFFSRAQTGWLMHYAQGKPSAFALPQTDDPEAWLRKKLGWEDNPDWQHYEPLLKLARQHRLSLFGTDLPDGLRLRLTRAGLAGLSALERAEWSPTGFSQDAYHQLMRQKLADAHCGMAPEALLEALYATWVARNDAMARSLALMLDERPDEPLLMVLGAGHVAHDMGVYERLAFLRPGVRQINLAFQEHPAAPSSFRSIPKPLQIGQHIFAAEHQFLWFTPPAPDRGDPCARLAPPQRGHATDGS